MKKTALVVLIAALVVSIAANSYLMPRAGSCNAAVLHKAELYDEQCYGFRIRFETASRDLLNPHMRQFGLDSYEVLVSFWSINQANRCGVSFERLGERVCITSGDFACLSRLAAQAASEIVVDWDAQ